MAYKYRSLAAELAVVAEGVSAQQQRHFRTALGGLNLLKEVRRAVRAVLDGGTTLISSGGLDTTSDMLRRGLLDEGRRPGRLAVQLELEIAKRFALRTDHMAQRCLELARLALNASPTEPVQKFLSRVGRCYVAGLFPESVVMCRAVLEHALLDTFHRNKKPLPPTPPGRSEMRSRLSRAEELGWLTRRQRSDAWDIYQRGSKAVHEDPGVTADAIGTITVTLTLLGILYKDIGGEKPG